MNRELQVPVEVDFEDNNSEKHNFAIQNQRSAAAPLKAVITKKAGIFAALVMLLVFGIYYLLRFNNQ